MKSLFVSLGRLQALGQHLVFVYRRRRVWLWLCDEAGTELDFESLHFVVMKVLLDQIALSSNTGFHIWRDIRYHPGHKKLHHKHHMLQEDKNIPFAHKFRKEYRIGQTNLHNNDEGHFCSQDMPKLHCMSILLLMTRRVSIVSISKRKSIKMCKLKEIIQYTIKNSISTVERSTS